MSTNMVLRFRDLIADTITEHRNCVTKYGYVWYAWWNKPEEKVPYKEFSHFQDCIRKNGFMWIYLADSGTLHLYKAKLVDIDIAEDEDLKECQDIEKVPEYYFMAKYKVWFRFENIIDVFPDEIQEWSYDYGRELKLGANDNFFHNRRISNIKEMLTHCHRTIYFIQSYDPEKHNDNHPNNMKAENNQYLSKSALELGFYVQNIIEIIEDINKQCDLASKKKISPICLPPYPKEMENVLKRPAKDDASFRDFSSYIYMLIVDGHNQVKNDNAIISKSDFLQIADSLLNAIRTFRCNFHHLNKQTGSKKKLGDLFNEIAGKSVLDDSSSKIKFQKKLLIWTAAVLKNEYKLVKNTIASSEC